MPPVHPQKRFATESIILFVGSLVLISVAVVQGWFTRLDNATYDLYINRHIAYQAPDVVIVAIDDASLHAYGPWPWPRDLQGHLLSKINAHGPASVAMDIIYSGTTPLDASLLAAAAQTDNLALPVMMDTINFQGLPVEVMPFPDLLALADVSGHVQFDLDDDAIVRGTHLYQGIGSPRWPHLMLALHGSETSACDSHVSSLQLHQCDYVRVPFAGPSGTYPRVSARDLLQDSDNNLTNVLQGKTVLVGLTGLGVGDWVTSPNSAQNGPIPGVEFNANLYAALTQDALIRPAGAVVSLLLAMLVVGLCTYLLPRLAAKTMLATTIGLAVLPVIANLVSIHWFQYYLSVAAASIGVLMLYPIWSWRRQEIAWAYIQQELARIDTENTTWQEQSHLGPISDERLEANVAQLLLGDINNTESGLLLYQDSTPTEAEAALLAQLQNELTHPDQAMPVIPGERLAAQIERLEFRARQMREGRAVSLTGLGRMANGVVIFSALGRIRFSNDAAENLLHLHDDATQQKSCFDLLAPLVPPLGDTWPDMVHEIVFHNASYTFEATVGNSPLYVAAEPLTDQADSPYAAHWVLTIADLSAIRQAQAQREEALAFLSHDIRSPLLSVLALIRNHGTPSELLERISQYTQKGLATSDQFLQLSRLQLQHDFETYDLAADQLIANAVEQVFFLAKDKDITLRQEEHFEDAADEDEPVWISGNGELLERALVNLLGNAIKYSDPGTEIVAKMAVAADQIRISITDHGHGIPAEELNLIFDPYFRSGEQVLAENRGAGLGLRFVKTVVERHGGSISVDSEWGQGSTFTIVLARIQP